MSECDWMLKYLDGVSPERYGVDRVIEAAKAAGALKQAKALQEIEQALACISDNLLYLSDVGSAIDRLQD